MKQKVQTLQDFGEVLHEVRSKMGYGTDLLAFDLKNKWISRCKDRQFAMNGSTA